MSKTTVGVEAPWSSAEAELVDEIAGCLRRPPGYPSLAELTPIEIAGLVVQTIRHRLVIS